MKLYLTLLWLPSVCREAKAAEIQSLVDPEGANSQQIQQLSAEIQLLEAEGALLQQVQSLPSKYWYYPWY